MLLTSHKNIYYLFTAVISLMYSCTKNEKLSIDNSDSTKPVFEKIGSNLTNLKFKNTIIPNIATNENLFNYDYFYNGAGVGIADLNNDNLPDIFFCGNQVTNKLYLNEGNLTFKDISKTSNINVSKGWANGVSFVDINNDGWLDIYISQGGPKTREERKNLLFLNQKDETFKEAAEEYGLADTGISTQTVFFDIDNDNDLDCLVLNENEYYGVDPINLYKLIEKDEDAKYYNSSHLYLNNNGKFKNITKQAGIENPIFGLGITVSDFNKDGWLDFYFASDYYIPDALYINNHNGTFSDEIKSYTNHISYYGMGMDVADINNDLKQDIFVLDMAANDHVRSKTLMASMNTGRFNYLVNKANFHHQYMYNSLQLQQANQKYTNIAQATSMANTDWSWSVLLSDFDHDTDKDVYITNGYRKYALDNDLQRKVYEAKIKYKGNIPLSVKKNLYESMPSEKLPNILFQNNSNLNFKEKAKEWGLADYSFSNGSAVGDLDNDGDLDMVVNNIDEECFLYKNLTMENNRGNYLKIKAKGNLSESFPKITIKYNKEHQFIETRRIRGYRSAHENVAHFGIGNHKKIDTITVEWLSGKVQEKYNVSTNQSITFLEKEASKLKVRAKKNKNAIFSKIDNTSLGLDFIHKENVYDDFEKEILLPYKQSTQGPYISKADVNNDGLEDFYIGGASGQNGVLYIQTKTGKFIQKNTSAFVTDSGYEDMQSIFFDFDNDKDMDLFVVSGGNEFGNHSSLYTDRLYINNGNGDFTRAPIDSFNANPKSGKSVSVVDFDKDGDLDLVLGNRIIPQNYPKSASSILWENNEGSFKDVTKQAIPDLLHFGMVNKVITTDYDADGWDDLIVVGEWTGIGFFKNENGTFKREYKLEESNTKGWWFSIQETDVNNDGLPDYLIGNVGLNIKFKASESKPFKVFANDFDKNGTLDIVLGKKYQGEYVPVRGRECSSQQMPFIQEKFKTYSNFAKANLVDIYGENLNSDYEGEVNEFKSILLVNKGKGNFKKTILPFEAQLIPIMKAIFLDVNNDGYEDAIVGGNIYDTEVETPRLDGASGLILISNTKDGYKPLSWEESGLLINGDIKDLELIKTERQKLLIATENNSRLKIFQLNK